MSWTEQELRELKRIRHEIIGARVVVAAMRLHLALKAGFNPNQPRVPAGNSEGGRWTRIGGGTGTGAVGLQSPGRADGSSANAGRSSGTPAVSQNREVVRDRSGDEPWSSYVNTFHPDGSLAEQMVLNRDGSAIRSEFSASPDVTGWDERHTVVDAKGNIATFQNVGLTQTIFGRGGEVLGATTWTGSGPEPEPIVQPAFAPAVALLTEEAVTATIELGMTLYAWLSSRRLPGKQPVIAFRARDYRRIGDVGALAVDYVGLLHREDLEAACPGIVDIQQFRDEAAGKEKKGGPYSSSAAYGTAVHKRLEEIVNGLGNRDLRAEVSLLKTREATYRGEKDSIRIDVFDNRKGKTAEGTVCVSDPKTGKEPLPKGRATEIARRSLILFPETRRVIVIAIRPKE